MNKTWGGRFAGRTDSRVELFTESISLDQRLYRHDIIGSQAHARMLAHVGLLTPEEGEKIVQTLEEIGQVIERGEMEFTIELEDIHTHIEGALIDQLGELGRKLHTGRSRNDQIATDLKLWMRDAIDEIDALLRDLQKAFLECAERDGDVTLPGYTHLQRAQPVLAAHYFLAYVERFQRNRDRLADARNRADSLPLGSAALAGTTLPIDRQYVAELLGFSRVTSNSLDTTGDRDFLQEYVFCLSLIGLHLSGWAEEWILWATTEFGFLTLPDEFCTGSSIMPHKKNPDVLELTRGKCARVIGSLNHLLMLTKSLPLAYNRDLQEDKAALFDAHDTVAAMLGVAAPLVQGASLNRERINARIDDGFLDATTLMEFFIAKGMAMRSAHEAVGKLVRECEQRNCRLADLPEETLNAIIPGKVTEAKRVLGVGNALSEFRSYGSTGPREVAKQIHHWRERLR